MACKEGAEGYEDGQQANDSSDDDDVAARRGRHGEGHDPNEKGRARGSMEALGYPQFHG